MTFSSFKKLMEPAERSPTSNVLSLWKNKEGGGGRGEGGGGRGEGGGGRGEADDGISIRDSILTLPAFMVFASYPGSIHKQGMLETKLSVACSVNSEKYCATF